MIDAGVITVDLLLAPESRPGDLRVRRASLLNERTLNLMDRLARSLGSCREVVPARLQPMPLRASRHA